MVVAEAHQLHSSSVLLIFFDQGHHGGACIMQGLKPHKYLGDDFLVFGIEHFVDFDSCTHIPLDKIPVSLLLDPPGMLLLLLTD
jgi:hypothetical protein